MRILEYHDVHRASYASWARAMYARALGEAPPRVAIAGTLRGRVNHGRWIVDCPVPGCNNAHLVSLWERLFLCNVCGEGRWYDVELPPGIRGIEVLLEPRPRPAQNWEPGETVEQLLRENRERGIG